MSKLDAGAEEVAIGGDLRRHGRQDKMPGRHMINIINHSSGITFLRIVTLGVLPQFDQNI